MRINERKAAEHIGIPFWTLRYRRRKGMPLIRYINVEGRPWYEIKDLNDYIAAATIEAGAREDA